jgi:hypothetical protein
METVIENAVVEALYGRKEPAVALGEAQAELLHLTAAK